MGTDRGSGIEGWKGERGGVSLVQLMVSRGTLFSATEKNRVVILFWDILQKRLKKIERERENLFLN